MPLGYQYIFGGSSGNCNVAPQTSWAMNFTYNRWGGLVGDENMIPQQKIVETLDNLGLGHLNSIMGGPKAQHTM